jgi:K+-transporting ATPase ATPase C chain
VARTLTQSILLLLVLTVLTGFVYPFVVTALARLCCRGQAEGSLLLRDGRIQGSALLGQPFSDPKYFWSRPSATTPQPYNGAASGGSNLSPTNSAQVDAVKMQLAALKDADPGNTRPVPVDLVTASASGLDPDISPAAADYQVGRVARVRGLDPGRVRTLVAAHRQPRQWGFLGEPRVNVLQLNLALDALH